MDPDRDVQAERPPPLPATQAPQALSVTAPGRDRVIHSHTSPPKPSCFRSSRAGVGNLARPARFAAPPGRPDGARGQGPCARCAPRAARCHTAPGPLWVAILQSQGHAARRGATKRDACAQGARERAREAARGRDRGVGGPAGAHPRPQAACGHDGGRGRSEGLRGPRGGGRGTGGSGRRPRPGTQAGATGAQWWRAGVGTAARPHLPGRCPAAESRASLSEVELSWSTAQAALKAAASSSMGAGSQAGSGAGSGTALGARSQAGGDERAPERGRSALSWSRSCRCRRRCQELQQAPRRAPGGSRGCHGNGGGGWGARGGGEARR